MFFKKKPKIKFFTLDNRLAQMPELYPQPASKFFPEWIKTIRKTTSKENVVQGKRGNIKNCPVFAEFLTQGYIIPMWCDTYIECASNGRWEVKPSIDGFSWDIHDNEQFLDFLPDFKNKSEYTTLKANSPWFIKTDPGYSVYQMFMYYDFNQEFELLPGSINSDVWPQINQQILVKEKDKTIFIPRGAPFAWYVPYKREKYDLVVEGPTQENKNYYDKTYFSSRSKFFGGYKGMQK